MTDTEMPPLIQAVGLASVPVVDMPADQPALCRVPIAAAIVTLALRDDGHREIAVARHSDARAAEFPLPWLIDQALIPGAPMIVTPADAAMLTIAAMERRFWAEPRLACLMRDRSPVDPTQVGGIGVADEAALCHRLGIPPAQVTGAEVEQSWARHTSEPAIDAALGVAVARLMLWAHGAAFAAASPEPFFETLLPLAAWLAGEAERVPSLDPLLRSRPIRRATSFASYYREYRSRRCSSPRSPAIPARSMGSAGWVGARRS